MQLGTFGTVTFVNAMEVKKKMDLAMDKGDYCFNCEGLTQIDSTLVSLILHAMRRAKTSGQKVRLEHEPKGFSGLVALYGIENAFADLRA